MTGTEAIATPAAQIAEQVRSVLALRVAKDTLAASVKQLREDFEAAHKPLLDELREATRRQEEGESFLRSRSLAHFGITKDVAPAPGVKVVIKTGLKYDPADAFAWGQKSGMAITPPELDVKAFEAIAKATPLPFVEKTETPQVQIATDLAKALGEGQ